MKIPLVLLHQQSNFNLASIGKYHITRMVMAMQYVAFLLLAQYQMHDCQLHYPSSLQEIFEKHDISLMIEIVLAHQKAMLNLVSIQKYHIIRTVIAMHYACFPFLNKYAKCLTTTLLSIITSNNLTKQCLRNMM